MKVLLVPVKDPSRAKQRLSGILLPEERARLDWAMFEDVSRALEAITATDRVVVVTSDGRSARHARELGWDVIFEEAQISESDSVDCASRLLRRRGATAVLRLPADIPLVQASDVERLLDLQTVSPSAVLVPSWDGLGTNALLRTPPDVFPSRFGPNSLALHQQEAQRAGVPCVLVDNPRIALDLDEPADLSRFLARGQGTRTFHALADMGIPERLKPLARL